MNQCVQVNHCNIHGCSSANLRVITENSTLFCKRAIWRKRRTLLLWSRPTHDADFHGCAALVYNSIMQLNSFRLSVHAWMLADGHSQRLENPDVICRFSILSHFFRKQKSNSRDTQKVTQGHLWTKINKHMGIRERFDFPSFEGLDATKTTKVPKSHFYALSRNQAIISNDNGITLQCNVFFWTQHTTCCAWVHQRV